MTKITTKLVYGKVYGSLYGIAAIVLSGALGVPSAEANSVQKSWAAFQIRCLLPFEDFKPAVVDDLQPVSGRDGAFQLDNGSVLIVGGEEDLGSRSCAVQGSGLVRGYKEWSALVLQTGIYRETDTPGLWMSHEWIEPRIIVEKTPGMIRVVESELEA